MRYVVVTVADGEAGVFNKKLSAEAFEKFKVKSSKLPAHITLKAPFETEEPIEVLEEAIEKYIKDKKAIPYEIKGFEHFDNRVIYMDVNMSNEGKVIHDKLIDILDNFDYIEFNKKDGKDKIFHVTLTSKKVPSIYKEVWEYVNKYPFEFNCYFDNISIFKWVDNTWKLHKEFIIEN